MSLPTPLEVLDEGAVRRWVFRARSSLSANRERLDRLNVFPVPDGDTGTNMYLTLHAALESLIGMYLSGGPTRILEGTQAMARSTLLSARGNSGVILSQLVRGLAEVVTEAAKQVEAGQRDADAAALDSGGEGQASDTDATSEPGQRMERVVEGIDGRMFARALRAASDRAWQGVSNPVEGTILTVAKAAADSAEASARRDPSLANVTTAALDGARTALAATPALLPSLAKAGVVDAGGAGYVLILTALSEIVTGRVADPVLDVLPGGASGPGVVPAPRPDRPSANSQLGPAFEVMYLLEGCPDSQAERLRGDLLALGDSVLVVGTVDLRTVHVHTDDAGQAIEVGLECGRVYGIRISWLRDSPAAVHSTLPCPVGPIPPNSLPLPPTGSRPAWNAPDLLPPSGAWPPGSDRRAHAGPADGTEATFASTTAAPGETASQVGTASAVSSTVPRTDGAEQLAGSEGEVRAGTDPSISELAADDAVADEVAVVACAAGAGLAEAFTGAGAVVVACAPGTRATPKDITTAIERTGARAVLILPNDADTIMAAHAAVELAAEAGVLARVVPTRWAVQGIAAMAVHQSGVPLEQAVEQMERAADGVAAGSVVVASRRAHTEVGWCQEGDVIGFVDNRAIVIGDDLPTVATQVVEHLLTDTSELVTLIAGTQDPQLADTVAAALTGSHPDVEVIAFTGGQRTFALLLGVE